MPDPIHERRQRLTGIALMCGAVTCFGLLDATAKYLNLHMNPLAAVWARYTGAFLLPFIVSNPWSRPGLIRTTRPGLQVFRSALLLGSTVANFTAVRYLQLDQAVAIRELVAVQRGAAAQHLGALRRLLHHVAAVAQRAIELLPLRGLRQRFLERDRAALRMRIDADRAPQVVDAGRIIPRRQAAAADLDEQLARLVAPPVVGRQHGQTIEPEVVQEGVALGRAVVEHGNR